MANDPLCKLDDVKQWLDIKPTEESQDDDLDWLVQACSAQIAQYCGRDNLGSVVNYSESYRPRMNVARPRIILRHYPVVTLVGVSASGISIPIRSASQVQTNINGGVFLEDNARTLAFLGWVYANNGYVLVNYSAGYDMTTNQTPFGLRQAAIQFVAEVFKSSDWIGYRSRSLDGQSTVYDAGSTWGMSPRTKSMLEPYVNRIPPYV